MDHELLFTIVAADPLVRAGLAARIEAQSNCKVVNLASPSEVLTDMNAVLQDNKSLVAIWDLGLENSDSLALDFNEAEVPVILLLADDLEIDELWSTGARGLIKRDASGKEIVATAMAVYHGKLVLDPELSRTILPLRAIKPDELPELPTQREHQVLQLLAEGYTNKGIAENLGISEHTVKFHVNSIFGKLNVQSRTEAVVQATRLGLIAL